MSIREYFPGANTPDGFCSYYSHILTPPDAKKIIILKGGPGTGKSSIMKKLASFAIKNGHDAELLHCSSDPASLDGVCIRKCGFLIMDGTSPHVSDPSLPGCVDEIINLGDYWNESGISPHKSEIQILSSDISDKFKTAYKYLHAARDVKDAIKTVIRYDKNIVSDSLEQTKKELGISDLSFGGKERCAFLSAHTHAGRISYDTTFADTAKYIIRVVPDNGGAWEEYMNGMKILLLQSGRSIRSFKSSMDCGVPEHIYVENEDVFITVSESSGSDEFAHCIIDFGAYEENVIDNTKIQSDIKLYGELIGKATATLKDAKKLHDDLEKFYIPNMDFEKANQVCKNIIKKFQSCI